MNDRKMHDKKIYIPVINFAVRAGEAAPALRAGMLGQITTRFRVQKGDQIAYLDKKLILGPFLGSQYARVAFRRQCLDAASRLLISMQPKDLPGGIRSQTTPERFNKPLKQSYRSAFRSHKQIRIK